jgi:hypothetical protein
VQQAGPEGQGSRVLRVQVRHRWHGEVQVQHLRVRALGPGGARQLRHLLERQPGSAGAVLQHAPVLAEQVRLVPCRGLVTRAVPQAQQLPVELRQLPRVRAVQDRLS